MAGLVIEADTDAPLQQGDILKDVLLYRSAEDGEPVAVDVSYVLVISRNCNAVRKPTVTVAVVTEMTPEEFKELKTYTLDRTRRYLAALRDGDGSPDRLYLGSLLGRSPYRAFAHLDLMYSIDVPTEDDARQRWISQHRCGALSGDHRRHLHATILVAFGREGHDDLTWWPDDDLKLMIAAGQRDVSNAQLVQADATAEFQSAPVGAPTTSRVTTVKLNAAGEKAAKSMDKVQEANNALKPYLEEWERRYPGVNPLG